MKKKCKLCGKQFDINENLKRSREKQFCSLTCSSTYNGKNNKDKKRTVEQRKKRSELSFGDKNNFFGKKHSDKSKSKMKESSKWSEKKFKYCNLNFNEKEVLDGLLLSDGCLSEKSRISARLSFGFKYREMVVEILKNFTSFNFCPIWQSKKTNCFHSKTNMYHDLLLENKRWYPKGIKIVPKDVLITKTSCYWWFIGDGYITEENVYLCTDSFTKEDNMFLIKSLQNKGFNPSLTTRNRLRFNKKETRVFLEWIKPENGILKEYKYKWKIT